MAKGRRSARDIAQGRARTQASRADAGVDLDDREFRKGLASTCKRIVLKSTADLSRLGLMVQNDARRFCPVDTGRLRSSIQHVAGRDSRGPYVDVGTNVEYGPPVEYGTSRSPAQPFMRPALMTATQAWVGLARDTSGSLSEAAGREWVDYTTKDGRTIKATRAQVHNWTKGGSRG